jgi:RNA polymerase sigma-70 factor (ECF subfamily)
MKAEKALLEKCCGDDRRAHQELYKLCFPVLYATCSRYYINKEDRISALNLVFVKLIKNMKDYLRNKQHIEFEYWMRRVSINHIIDEFRRDRRYHEMISLHDNEYRMERAHQADAELQYNLDELRALINGLPPASRTVFNLYAVDGYKHEEIAGMLGISVGTSKAHLFRARQKLQQAIQNLNKKPFIFSA